MNLITYSPIITLLYAWALLWITMDLHFRDLTPKQKWLVPLLAVFLAAVNQMLRVFSGSGTLGRLIPLTMHLPSFLFFLHLTKCGIFKMVFMILSAMVFSAPIVLVTTFCKLLIPLDSPLMLLINLAACAVMLLAVHFIFRHGFHYLLKYGGNKLLLLFCLVPLLYYIYTVAVANVDLSGLTSASWIIIRILPTLNVYVFYFLLLYNYRELSRRHELEAARTALSLELAAVEEQLALLSEAQNQSAIYRHDMRHHLTAINGFLAEGEFRQAEKYIQKVCGGIEAVAPRRFCENRLVDLLCSSFASQAEQRGVRLTVEAGLPETVPFSDTELCAMISNGLENALNAAAGLEESQRWVSFYCGVRAGKLLLEIKNPYAGRILFQDGLPAAAQPNHGYGCRSICTIVRLHRGLCEFKAENGSFTLRAVLPM